MVISVGDWRSREGSCVSTSRLKTWLRRHEKSEAVDIPSRTTMCSGDVDVENVSPESMSSHISSCMRQTSLTQGEQLVKCRYTGYICLAWRSLDNSRIA